MDEFVTEDEERLAARRVPPECLLSTPLRIVAARVPHRPRTRRRGRPNTAPSKARSLSEAIRGADNQVSTMRSTSPRFREEATEGRPAPNAYRPDTALTVAGQLEKNARRYGIMQSRVPRFSEPKRTVEAPGPRLIASELPTTRPYSAMRSTSPRFSEARPSTSPNLGPGWTGRDLDRPDRPQTGAAGFGHAPRFAPEPKSATRDVQDHDGMLEHGHTASLVAAATQSPRRYSVMQSRSPRFVEAAVDRDLRETLARVQYDTETHGPTAGMIYHLERSPRTYRGAFEARGERLPIAGAHDRYLEERLARLDYRNERATSLATQVRRSPRGKHLMRGQERFADQPGRRPVTAPHVGPGYYDTVRGEEAMRPKEMPVLPLSQLPRFHEVEHRPSRHLASPFRLERENRRWTESPRGRISQSARPPLNRDIAVNDLEYDTDKGHKQTLGRAARLAAGHPSASMASRSPRLASFAASYRCPGQDEFFVPRTTSNGAPAGINATGRPPRPTPALASRVERFHDTSVDRSLREALSRLDYRAERYGTVDEDIRAMALTVSHRRD